MIGWHPQLDGHEFEQALGVGDGQGSLACCSAWGRKELNTTEQLNCAYICNMFWGTLSICVYTGAHVYEWVIIIQSCLILCNTMDCSPPGSFVHWILQTRILEWVAISFSNICAYIYIHTHIHQYIGRYRYRWTSLIAQLVKNSPTMQETQAQFQGWEYLLRRDRLPTPVFMGFPGGSDGKEPTCNMGDWGSILGLGRVLGGDHGNPLQYSCLGESPWAEKPGRLQSMGLQQVGHDSLSD